MNPSQAINQDLWDELVSSGVQFLRTTNPEERVVICAHQDTDGISAALILQTLLQQRIKQVELRFTHRLEDLQPFDQIPIDRLVILDFSLKEIRNFAPECTSLMIDHHPIAPDELAIEVNHPELIIVNPFVSDRFATLRSSVSTSLMSYYLYHKATGVHDSQLAIAGVIGGLSDQIPRIQKNLSVPFENLFEYVMVQAEQSPYHQTRADHPSWYGLSTRNLVSLMTFTDFESPFRNKPAQSLRFLRQLRIDDPQNQRYLSLPERDQRLLVREFEKLLTPTELRSMRASAHLYRFIRYFQILPFVPLRIPIGKQLLQFEEIATIVNVVGRSGCSQIGLAILRGEYEAMKIGLELLEVQKRELHRLIKRIRMNHLLFDNERCLFFELEPGSVTLLSTITAILSDQFPRYVIVGAVRNVTRANEARLSVRTSQYFLRKHPGLDLSQILASVIREIGGQGGGHPGAIGVVLGTEFMYRFVYHLISNINEATSDRSTATSAKSS